MENKSFEQRVQEEMAGVWMQPDAKLWPEIARHLDQKKRRRGLIWWCFLGVLAGAGGWIVFENQQHKRVVNVRTSVAPAPDRSKDTAAVSSRVKTSVSTNAFTVPTTPAVQRVEPKFVVHLTDIDQTTIHQKEENETTADKALGDKTLGDKAAERKITDGQTSRLNIIGNPKLAAEADQQNEAHQQVVSLNPQPADTGRLDLSDSTALPAKRKKFPWKWSFNLSAGISGVRNDLFIANKSAAYLDLAYSSSPIPGGSSGGSGGGIVVPVPVVLKDAAATETSIQLSRDWDKHWGWYAKVGYNYAQYRLIYNNADYYNRFHLMGITAGLSYSFLLRSGSTIGLNTGLQESLLLGYSATQLPAAANLPNKSMGDFKRYQTAFVFGMEAGFGKSRHFYLGPQLRYQLNQLSSTPGSNHHLVYILLQARWQIIKK